MFFKDRGSRISIKDITSDLEMKAPSIIGEDATIEDVMKMIIGAGGDRILYVVNDKNELVGTISIDELIRIIFSASHEVRIHSRRLMDIVTSETASHIMKKNPSFAQEDDFLEDVIKKMIKTHAKHIAFLDENKNVIGDISMVELIKALLKINNMEDLIEA
jgi:CBS domain-containing protein